MKAYSMHKPVSYWFGFKSITNERFVSSSVSPDISLFVVQIHYK